MVKRSIFIGFVVLFALALFSSAAFAKGKPHTNSHQSITYDVPDEGDNFHPSGKDRSVEHGGSTMQGNSHSDPDDNHKGSERSNKGPDKQPDGVGGIDRRDQDNNNGCGNDDDFEDDNEGRCGRKPEKDQSEGGKGEHKNCNGHKDEKDTEKPTLKQPVLVSKGEVLGVKSLPITGSNPLVVTLCLLLCGTALQVISRRFEPVSINKG